MTEKYKDRNPEETIKIIQDFFHKRNYTYIVEETSILDQLLFSCSIELFYNNQFVLKSNGKGTSQIYSLASGFAELYERFCSKIKFFHNPYLKAKAEKLYPNLFSTENNFLETDIAKRYFNTENNSEQTIVKEFFKSEVNNKYFNKEYINLDGTKKIILDPRFIYTNNGSTGLAAGNTLEEALVQGISEIYERTVFKQLFTIPQENYYQLDLKNLPIEFQNIITELTKQKYKIFIYDLSFNFDLPVCMVILQNPYTNCSTYHLGAFPIFNIALERCFTEIFQGTSEHLGFVATPMDYYQKNNKLQGEFQEYVLNNEIPFKPYPNFIFTNTKIINKYNVSVYQKPNKKITNKDLLNYFYQKNPNFYYANFSLSKKMYAIHIINPENITMDKINLNIDDILRNDDFNTLYQNIISKNKYQIKYYSNINKNQNLELYNFQNDKITLNVDDMLFQIINTDIINFSQNFQQINSFFIKDFIKYYTLKNYILANVYNSNEIINIFKTMGIEISIDDINNINNKEYLYEHIFLEPFYKEYDSQNYNNFITSIFIQEEN